MNKRVLIFSIYCILIITALVLFLVFFPPNSANATNIDNSQMSSQVEEDTKIDLPNKDDSNVDDPSTDDSSEDLINKPNETPTDSDETDENQSTDIEDGTEDSELGIDSEDELIYAKSLILKCPRSITINLSESVSLIGEYISIYPAESAKFLNCTISSRYGSEPSGISFSDNVITAKQIGTYYIKFTIPKAKNQYLTDGIQVSVVDNENTNVVQLINALEIGSNYNLEAIFQFDTKAKIGVVVLDTDYLNYGNYIFTPLSEGEARIIVSLSYDYIQYNYTYAVTIKPKPLPPEYMIEIYAENADELKFAKGDIYPLMYNIIDKNGMNVYQKISVVSSDTGIVEVSSIDHPLIYLKCKDKGEVTLTITCLLDEQVTKEIKIIVF